MKWIDAFLKGMARILDPLGHSAEVKAILKKSDADAIHEDWLKVVSDWNKPFHDAWDDPEMDVYDKL